MKLIRYILCAIGQIRCGNTRYAKGSSTHLVGKCDRWMFHYGRHRQKRDHIRWDEGTEGRYYD